MSSAPGRSPVATTPGRPADAVAGPPRRVRLSRVWRDPGVADPAAVASLESALRAPRVVAELLARRGYFDPQSAKTFLRPRLEQLSDPWALPDMTAAVERIRDALRTRETVLVHGDYDVDGLCGVALLVHALRALGLRAEPFVPHRLQDGYDLGRAGLEAARAIGARLVVTCDCGTTAVRAVAEARASGIDVVVTDHHVVGDALPPAVAVVNPQRPDSRSAALLCGTGVAYKLLEALSEAIGRPRTTLYKFLDLVAIATVADQVPVVGENRLFVRFGLRLLSETRNPGLRELLRVVRLEGRRLSAHHAAFVFGPRLNAAGRMGAASRGVQLLLARSEAEARPLADELERENRARQEVDRRTFGEAMEWVERSYEPDRDYALVLASESWHPGVVGIVASRVVEQVYRPTVLIAVSGEHGRGSGRSIPAFHLYDALRSCGRHLERFGGHRYAAGLEIRVKEVDAFRAAFVEEARTRLSPEDVVPVLSIDAELGPEGADAEVWRFLRHMGPFGLGNAAPLFVARGAAVSGPVETVGPGHLKFRFQTGGRGPGLPAIGFHMADGAEWLRPGSVIDAVYRLQARGRGGRDAQREPEAVIVDLRPGGS